MRRFVMPDRPCSPAIALSLLLLPLLWSAAAADVAALYRSKTIVTGQEEPQRLEGFVRCFEQVLVKASGDPRLANHPKLAEIAAEAASYVTDFRHRDRMEGMPVHDEQGTRERPYDLTVDFDPQKVDAALATLGSQPWLAERPRLVLFATVTNAHGSYVLASDGESGRDMREGLAAAADRLGMAVTLPDDATLQDFGLTAETLPNAVPEVLDDVANAAGGEVALSGTITWSSRDLGWVARWRMDHTGHDYEWQIGGVGFDQAFRTGIGGAAQILSGNGAPD